MSTPTFYVADPFPVYRLGLKNLLGAQFRNWDFAEFASYPALLAVLQNGGRPQVLLFDPHLAGSDLLPGLRHLRQRISGHAGARYVDSGQHAISARMPALGGCRIPSQDDKRGYMCEAIHAIVAGDRCLLPAPNGGPASSPCAG